MRLVTTREDNRVNIFSHDLFVADVGVPAGEARQDSNGDEKEMHDDGGKWILVLVNGRNRPGNNLGSQA